MSSKLPDSVLESIQSFHNALEKFEQATKNSDELVVDEDFIENNPLESARIDLCILYAVNSAMWMKMCCDGHSPATNATLKGELDRIKELMGKLKLAEDKKSMPRIDAQSVKRFVRNATWDIEETKKKRKK